MAPGEPLALDRFLTAVTTTEMMIAGDERRGGGLDKKIPFQVDSAISPRFKIAVFFGKPVIDFDGAPFSQRAFNVNVVFQRMRLFQVERTIDRFARNAKKDAKGGESINVLFDRYHNEASWELLGQFPRFYNLNSPIDLNRMLSAIVTGIVETANDANDETQVVEAWLSKYLVGDWGVYNKWDTPPGFAKSKHTWNVGMKRGEGYLEKPIEIPPPGPPPPVYIRGHRR